MYKDLSYESLIKLTIVLFFMSNLQMYSLFDLQNKYWLTHVIRMESNYLSLLGVSYLILGICEKQYFYIITQCEKDNYL